MTQPPSPGQPPSPEQPPHPQQQPPAQTGLPEGYQQPLQYPYPAPPPAPTQPQGAWQPYPPAHPQGAWQPYPPYYPAPAQPWRIYRRSTGLAVTALVVGGLWTLTEIVEAFTAWPAGETYAQAARDQVPVDGIFTAYDGTGIAWGLVGIAAYVVNCLWLWRARQNAETISASPHKRSSGWVWGSWLVPVVCLWFPFQIVRDVRKATWGRAGALVGWWWAAWLVTVVTSRIGPGLTPISGMASEGKANALGPVETVDALVVSLAFVLWCLVVVRVVREQDRAVTGGVG